MCLILVAWQQHPDYPLLLAANRDEAHARPTQAAGFWPDAPAICAGRDLQAGGTWLGVSRNGRFATVTNYRGDQGTPAGGRSRGAIPPDFLASDEPPAAFMARLDRERERYAGFSVLAGTMDGELWYLCNRERGYRRLDPGIYGLANAGLDEPWPKVVRGKAALTAAVPAATADALLALLADRTVPADADLPREELDLATRRRLAPLFIAAAAYGTRASTCVRIDRHGLVTLTERRFGPDGAADGDTTYTFAAARGDRVLT